MKHRGAALVERRWQGAGYRANARRTSSEHQAQLFLRQAGDAIHMAILTIAHHVGEEGRQKLTHRIERVQEYLVDACKALSRAKLYVAGLWTYAPEVILNQDPDPEREIARLNRITTILSMRNHAHLPKSRAVIPLSDQEEAQLIAVSQEVSPRLRAHRVSTVIWTALALIGLLMTPWLGAVSGVASLFFAILSVTQWRRAMLTPTPCLPAHRA